MTESHTPSSEWQTPQGRFLAGLLVGFFGGAVWMAVLMHGAHR